MRFAFQNLGMKKKINKKGKDLAEGTRVLLLFPFAEADVTQQFEGSLLRLSHVVESPGLWFSASRRICSSCSDCKAFHCSDRGQGLCGSETGTAPW